MKKVQMIDGSGTGEYYPAAEVDAELATLRAEHEQLFKIAVKAMQAIDEIELGILLGKQKELDHALATVLSEDLWERVNAAALKGKTE